METTADIEQPEPSELDQQLVAYLDGELDDEDRRAIENQLMEDADCKRRLRMLQQSFDLLDELPQTSAGPDFARTTVEFIAVSASQEMQILERRKPWRVSATFLGLLVATVSSFALGAFITHERWSETQNDRWQDLAVAEHLRSYSQIKSEAELRFIEALASDPQWNALVSMRRELQELPQRPVQRRLSAIALNERQAAVEQMPANARRVLQIQLEQFLSQTPEHQAELRSVMLAVEQRPDADAFTDTLVTYVDWLDSLPQSRVSTLQSTPATARIDAVHEIIQEEQLHGRDMIDAEDATRLYDAMLAIAQARIDAFERQLTSQQRAYLDARLAELKFKGEPLEPSQRLAHLLIRNLLTPRFFDKHGKTDDPLRVPPLTQAERQQLLAALSDRAKQSLRNAKDSHTSEGRLLMWSWIAMRKRSPLELSGYDPVETYENVDTDLRERIDLMEPSNALKTLRGRGYGDRRNDLRGARPGEFDPRDRQRGRPQRREGIRHDEFRPKMPLPNHGAEHPGGPKLD